MSNISSYYRSTSTRVTGLASGLDVDALVQASLAKQQSKVDKAGQNKTLTLWKQEAYRSVVTKLTDFQSTYLDILNPQSVLRKSSMNAYSASISSDAQKYMNVSVGSDARTSNITVNSIKSIATSQVLQAKADNKLASPISMTVDKSNLNSFAGKSISVTLDGVTKNVQIGEASEYLDDPNNADSFNIQTFRNDINQKLKDQFGTSGNSPKIQLSDAENTSSVLGVDKWAMSFEVQEGRMAKISSTSSSALGITNDSTNYLDTSKSIIEIFNGSVQREHYNEFYTQVEGATNKLATDASKVSFTINGVDFEFSAATSLKDVMNKVNASDAGVKMSYSSITDTMTITSSKTGSGDNIVMQDNKGTNFLKQAFGMNKDGTLGDQDESRSKRGTDAVLVVNNNEIVRSSNTFSIDGVNFELLGATPEGFGNIEVDTKIDSTQMMDTIKGFVEGYNKLVEELNALLTEKVSKDANGKQSYQPLTDAQKAEMTEKQIENWETEAKKGILRGDPTLTKMISSLRSAFVNTVDLSDGGGKQTFASIGITTSMLTTSNGKITIDETKLKAAIENDPDAVIKMFTQTSDIAKGAEVTSAYSSQGYTTKSQINDLRVSQMGVAQRFLEVFNNNINSSYGSEGSLIKIAGTDGKNLLIDRDSTLGKQLSEIEKNISKYQTKLYEDEDRLYAKYAALETALARMQQQSSYFNSNTIS